MTAQPIHLCQLLRYCTNIPAVSAIAKDRKNAGKLNVVLNSGIRRHFYTQNFPALPLQVHSKWTLFIFGFFLINFPSCFSSFLPCKLMPCKERIHTKKICLDLHNHNDSMASPVPYQTRVI